MIELTQPRLVVLKALSSGPKRFMELRLAYYGPERAQSKATTSFYNQIQRMMGLGLIKKSFVIGAYELTDEGRGLLNQADPIQQMVAKSQAQLAFENKKTGLLDQFGYPIKK